MFLLSLVVLKGSITTGFVLIVVHVFRPLEKQMEVTNLWTLHRDQDLRRRSQASI